MTFAVEREGFKVGTCKLCGQPIVWAFNSTGGGKIPLDVKAPAFAIVRDAVANDAFARRFAHNAGGDMILVSHFSTCPAKTRAHELLRQCARAFRQAGSGIYVSTEEAGDLMRHVHAYLRIEGP